MYSVSDNKKDEMKCNNFPSQFFKTLKMRFLPFIDETTKVTIGYRSKYDHLKEGQYYITISCNADCNPECFYQFYRDEQLVHKVDGTIRVLASRNMSGRYTCSAKNSVMKTYKISTNFVDISIKCMFIKVFC